MDTPAVVVVDTSAAVEVLVADAPERDRYAHLFRALRRAGTHLAFCELLEVELLEAAFTWDLRRERGRDWRRERRNGKVIRPRALERTIVSDWREFTAGVHVHVIGTSTLLADAAGLMGSTGLSSNDAVHLAVARSLDAPIVTHDRPMIRVAREWPGVLTGRAA